MADILETRIKTFDEIIKVYEDKYLQDALKIKRDEIKNILRELLENNAEAYGLTISNSVTNKYLFEFDPRIKDSASLKEKFIRRNDGLRIINRVGLTKPEDVARKKEELKNELKLFEDIIGIKIITELSRDVLNVYEMIKERESELRTKHIEFKDLSDQPKPMRNGLPIYNIKAVFNSENAFELQIKSKIYSAWTDMDHSLFYKEYSTSPIRDAVQVSMNKIGEILTKLEEFLYELRISQEDYVPKFEHFELLKRFHKEFSSILKQKLDTEYDISKIANILKFLLEQFNIKEPHLTSLIYDHLEYAPSSECNKNYINIRNEDFELIILETIYLNWKSKYENINISPTEYDSLLDGYINVLCTRIADAIIEEVKTLEEEEPERFIQDLMRFLLPYSNSSKILLHIDNYLYNYKIYQILVDQMQKDPAYSEEGRLSMLENVGTVSKLFAIEIFKCNHEEYLNLIKSDYQVIHKVTQSLLNIRDNYEALEEDFNIKELEPLTNNILSNIS